MKTAPMARADDGTFARLTSRVLRRPRRVLAIWVLVLVTVLALFKASGNEFSNSLTLPGTQSQAALNALRHGFPSHAGDQDQIVFATAGPPVGGPWARARITAALNRVAQLPHVVSVVSPFDVAGRSQVSRDHTVAFATVTFDGQARSLPVIAIDRVISVARSVRSPRLQVALGGQAIEHAEKPSLGPATAIGLIAAALVLLLTFGSLVAMGLPIITALLGLGVGISLAGLLSRLIQIPDFATQLAAMIGLGVGIDYALFIVTRYRENRRDGQPGAAAITAAMDSAGRAVLFAGVTVILALLGQLVLGVGLLDGLAVASALAVMATMLAALTALPALLSLLDRRLSPRQAQVSHRVGLTPRGPRRVVAAADSPTLWRRWSEVVARRPVAGAVAGTAVMLALAAPALSLRTGASDAGNDPPGHTTRQAFDLIARGFGAGANGPLSLVISLPNAHDRNAVRVVSDAVGAQADVASVSRPTISSDGRTAIIEAYPRSAPQAEATTRLVNHLRSTVLPRVARATAATLLVGGSSAAAIDFSHILSSELPLFIAVVLILSALLLAVAFRSVVIPIQAAVMNLLSIGAALGVTVAIFQWGWLGSVLGVAPGPIEGFIPEILFAIVFGLSMDYEVFLVSRIREHWLRTRDASAAVHHGLATTGRLITAAATIMICVFASFALGDNRDIKLFGISMASAVFLDAFVVRSLLMPSVLHLLGSRAWWMPAWLRRHTPEIPLERPATRLVVATEER